MALLNEPLLTTVVAGDDFRLPDLCSYIFAGGGEERAAVGQQWMAEAEGRGVRFVEVLRQEPDTIAIASPKESTTVSLIELRDQSRLREEVVGLAPQAVYLDVTGLTYSAWAPLLRALIDEGLAALVVYREPVSYTRLPFPSSGMIYDLSEATSPFGSLPGFASIKIRSDSDALLVPLLGFEGARFGFVIESSEVPPDRIVPVVGLPGFRPEFLSATFRGNSVALEKGTMHRQIRYARANCPFELFHRLFEIQRDYAAPRLEVAPVGTKPHGVGAVLYALSRPDSVGLLYDHPRKSPRRTSGASRVCIYDIGTFVESDLFNAAGEYEI